MKKFLIILMLFTFSCAYALNNDDAGTSGDALQIAMPLAAYGMTFYKDDAAGRPEFYKSFALNLGTSFALKSTVHKERPDHSGDDSFPSAHSSMAFQAAAFTQMRYGWQYGAPAYALAAYTGWTRLAVNEHDETDIAAGAVIGIMSAYLFTDKYNVAVTPVTDGKMLGLGVSMPW